MSIRKRKMGQCSCAAYGHLLCACPDPPVLEQRQGRRFSSVGVGQEGLREAGNIFLFVLHVICKALRKPWV